MGRVEGKIVVVTGAAAARAPPRRSPAREGATVVATDLHEKTDLVRR